MGVHCGEAPRPWSKLGLGSNSSLTTNLPAVCPWVSHLTSLSLIFLTCGVAGTVPTSEGVMRIDEILYIKCLASVLAYSKCSAV